MMNIFIMFLVAVFMMGYYMFSAPSVRVAEHETEIAITKSDLRTIAECAVAAHNAQINGYEYEDICVQQGEIQSKTMCLGSNGKETQCEIVRNKKPAGYVITTTHQISMDYYNDMLEILETYHSDAGNFGIFKDGKIISGASSNKPKVPAAIISAMNMVDGQLVYMTQYAIPDVNTEFTTPDDADVICPAGFVKTYRFGRWQCIGYNLKTDCAGDKIWNSEVGECVPDESRKPLCAAQQTAVMVDDVWECINPFGSKDCPNNMVAQLNYETLEWECVDDPSKVQDVKKCANISGGATHGSLGATLRVSSSSCTDCEIMVVDTETCTSYCVPDKNQLTNPRCYPQTKTCTGPSRAFYFGFPDLSYAGNVDAVRGISIPFDNMHSQNRKFNCLDCGDGTVDTDRSRPPFVAVCK